MLSPIQAWYRKASASKVLKEPCASLEMSMNRPKVIGIG
jgi:hypothetical protein